MKYRPISDYKMPHIKMLSVGAPKMLVRYYSHKYVVACIFPLNFDHLWKCDTEVCAELAAHAN